MYYNLATCISDYMKDCVGSNNVHFPIDIDAFANRIGIHVKTTDLNKGKTNNISKLVAASVYVTIHDRNPPRTKAYVTLDDKDIPEARRYALAQQIGFYWIRKATESTDKPASSEQENLMIFEDRQSLIPNFGEPFSENEMLEKRLADRIAMCITMPVDALWDAFILYLIGHRERPLLIEDMLDFLRGKVRIPTYNLAVAYHFIMSLMDFYVNQDEKKRDEFNRIAQTIIDAADE